MAAEVVTVVTAVDGVDRQVLCSIFVDAYSGIVLPAETAARVLALREEARGSSLVLGVAPAQQLYGGNCTILLHMLQKSKGNKNTGTKFLDFIHVFLIINYFLL